MPNSFLAGAYELRHGIPKGAPPKATGPDLISAMPTELWLDFLGIRLDESKADGLHFVMNLVTPDNGEKFVVELSNNTLTNIKGQQAKNPDMTITIKRSDLETVMMGQATLDDQIANHKAQLTGNRRPLDELKTMLVQFRMDFQILPGTGGTTVATPTDENPFEQESEAIQTITD